MLLFSYEKIFNINVLHGYYKDKLSSDLIFRPTSRTSRVLSNFGLKFYKEGTGFSILGETNSDGILKKPLPSSLKFTFLVELKSPYFINFSDLPFDSLGRIYRFSNENLNQGTVPGFEGLKLLLHPGISVDKEVLTKIEGDYFSYFLSGPESIKTAQIVEEQTGISVMSEEGTVTEGGNQFSFLLNGLDEGSYSLEVDNTTHDRFYYLPGFTKRETFGIIDIFIDTPGVNKFVNSAGRISFKEYCISFAARKTIWHYIIKNRNELSMPDPVVEHATLPMSFHTDSADSFTSVDSLALSESPVTNIRLLGDAGDPESVLIQSLPNPGPEMIRPDPDDLSKVYSDIYIYI